MTQSGHSDLTKPVLTGGRGIAAPGTPGAHAELLESNGYRATKGALGGHRRLGEGLRPSAAGSQLVPHNRQNGAATHTYDASAMAAHPQGLESNVVPFPEPPAKTLSADAAGPFTFAVWAATKVGGDALEPIWRDELVVIVKADATPRRLRLNTCLKMSTDQLSVDAHDHPA